MRRALRIPQSSKLLLKLLPPLTNRPLGPALFENELAARPWSSKVEVKVVACTAAVVPHSNVNVKTVQRVIECISGVSAGCEILVGEFGIGAGRDNGAINRNRR